VLLRPPSPDILEQLPSRGYLNGPQLQRLVAGDDYPMERARCADDAVRYDFSALLGGPGRGGSDRGSIAECTAKAQVDQLRGGAIDPAGAAIPPRRRLPCAVLPAWAGDSMSEWVKLVAAAG
jgi:hypothetical protein